MLKGIKEEILTSQMTANVLQEITHRADQFLKQQFDTALLLSADEGIDLLVKILKKANMWHQINIFFKIKYIIQKQLFTN